MINDGSLSKYGTTSLVSGIIMVFISLFMQGCQYVIEEHVFTHHQVDPYMMVGTEGLYGTSYIFVVIFIMSFINCPSQLMCDMTGYFEDFFVVKYVPIAFIDEFCVFFCSLAFLFGRIFANRYFGDVVPN